MISDCFTILVWFLSYINRNEPWVYMCPLPFESPSHILPIPTPPGYHRTLSLKETGSFTCVMFISSKSPIPLSRLLGGLLAPRPDFSETTFYLHLLRQWFFLLTKFLSSVDPRFLFSVLKPEAVFCKFQKRNEVVDLLPDKSVFLIRGDLLWGPKSGHCQILHVSWCTETVYTCVSNCLLRTCITYMIHMHIGM